MKETFFVWYSRCFRVKPEKAKVQTGVAVTGFLFALVIGQLAIAVADQMQPIFVEPLTSSTHDTPYDNDVLSWPRAKEVLRSNYITLLHLAVAITLTVTSAIGYYTSRNLPRLRVRFFNKSFVQFCLDVMMVFTYFLLIQVAEPSLSDADARPEVYLVFLSFILYLFWDIVSYKISRDKNAQDALRRSDTKVSRRNDERHDGLHGWIRRYGLRRWITVLFTAIVGVVVIIVMFAQSTRSLEYVTIFDLILIFLLIFYRIMKSVVDEKISTTVKSTKQPQKQQPVAAECDQDGG